MLCCAFEVVMYGSVFAMVCMMCLCLCLGSNDSRLHVVEQPRGPYIQDCSQDDQGFLWSRQSYTASLTHYSAEPLTTGPDYAPVLLLLDLDGDVHPNP